MISFFERRLEYFTSKKVCVTSVIEKRKCFPVQLFVFKRKKIELLKVLKNSLNLNGKLTNTAMGSIMVEENYDRKNKLYFISEIFICCSLFHFISSYKAPYILSH